MSLVLAGVGAVVAALIEFTVGPYLTIGGAHLHLVFVIAVIWTIVAGLDGGLAWAFIGGLTLDVLALRPLGSTAFVLLVIVGLAELLGRFLAQLRLRYVSPVAAVLAFSGVYTVLVAILYGAMAGSIQIGDPVKSLTPGILYDTVVAALIGPLAVMIRVRRLEQERVDW